jgi:hypothetical protein
MASESEWLSLIEAASNAGDKVWQSAQRSAQRRNIAITSFRFELDDQELRIAVIDESTSRPSSGTESR